MIHGGETSQYKIGGFQREMDGWRRVRWVKIAYR